MVFKTSWRARLAADGRKTAVKVANHVPSSFSTVFLTSNEYKRDSFDTYSSKNGPKIELFDDFIERRRLSKEISSDILSELEILPDKRAQ